MNKPIVCAAAALLALSALPALAQETRAPASPPGPVNPPTTTQRDDAAPPATAPSAAQAGVNTSVTVGMPVMDNTGLTIGQVTDVKADAAGTVTATIKMGADTFAVETARLAVSGNAVTVNATQSELKSMLDKK
jgi:hypothetical protein